jgi:Carboxypeptidase regulatory-like domain
MKWLLILGVLALASGCGGGGGGAAATGSISGSVTSLATGAPMPQVSISLTGGATSTTSTDANGAYSFTALAAGNYTLTAKLAGATISPSSIAVTVSDAASSGHDFVAGGGAVIASQIQFLPPAFLSSDQLRASVVPAGDGVLFTDSSDFPLKSVSPTTGAVTALAGRFRNAESVVISGQNVFWVDGGTLNESSLDGKTTRVLSRGTRAATYGGTAAVVVDASNAYWVSDIVSTDCSSCSYLIQRVPLDGSAPVTLATSDRMVVALAADADTLYWEEGNLEPVSPGCACGSTIHSIPKAGGAPTLLVDGLLNGPPPVLGTGFTPGSWYPAGGIAVTATGIVFATTGGPYVLRSVALGGGTVSTLASVSSSAGLSMLAIRNLSVTGGNVYWLDTANDTLDSVPLAGGNVTTIASGIGVPNQPQSPVALAINATSAYWTEAGAFGGCCLQAGAGTLKQVALAGGAVTVIASNLDAPTAIAVDGTHLVWTEAWRVAASPVAGGSTTTVASGIAGNMARITADATTVYVLDGDFIKTIPIAGGQIGKLAAAHGLIGDISVQDQDLVTDGSSVFWTVGVGGGAPPVVQKVAVAGGAPTVLSAETVFTSPQDCYWRIALAGGNVYWSAGSSQATPVGCTVMKVPMAGGATTTVVEVPFMRDFAVDANNVYFSEVSGGTIQRVPVGGGTPTTVVSALAWVLTSDANRLYWMDPLNDVIEEAPKTGTGGNGPQVLPVTLASDTTLAAEGLAVVAGGLYATSTQSGDILWVF